MFFFFFLFFNSCFCFFSKPSPVFRTTHRHWPSLSGKVTQREVVFRERLHPVRAVCGSDCFKTTFGAAAARKWRTVKEHAEVCAIRTASRSTCRSGLRLPQISPRSFFFLNPRKGARTSANTVHLSPYRERRKTSIDPTFNLYDPSQLTPSPFSVHFTALSVTSSAPGAFETISTKKKKKTSPATPLPPSPPLLDSHPSAGTTRTNRSSCHGEDGACLPCLFCFRTSHLLLIIETRGRFAENIEQRTHFSINQSIFINVIL